MREASISLEEEREEDDQTSLSVSKTLSFFTVYLLRASGTTDFPKQQWYHTRLKNVLYSKGQKVKHSVMNEGSLAKAQMWSRSF